MQWPQRRISSYILGPRDALSCRMASAASVPLEAFPLSPDVLELRMQQLTSGCIRCCWYLCLLPILDWLSSSEVVSLLTHPSTSNTCEKEDAGNGCSAPAGKPAAKYRRYAASAAGSPQAKDTYRVCFSRQVCLLRCRVFGRGRPTSALLTACVRARLSTGCALWLQYTVFCVFEYVSRFKAICPRVCLACV